MEKEMKKCSKCGKELPITDFYFRDKAKGIRRSECKYCHCQRVKDDYKKKHEQFNQMKSQYSCAKCGDSRVYVLDFHHLDPEEKDFTIGQGIRHAFDTEKIQEEIKKCVPLCANCHREFHYLEKEKGITTEEYLALK